MLRPTSDLRVRRALYRFLMSFLLACGVALTPTAMLTGGVRALETVLWCALFTLVFAGMRVNRTVLRVSLLSLAALECVLYFGFHTGLARTLLEAGKAVVLIVSNVSVVSVVRTGELTVGLALAASAVSQLLSDEELNFPFCAAFLLMMVIVEWMLGGRAELLYTLPALIALLMMLSQDNGHPRLLVVPVALLCALAALALTPPEGTTAEPFRSLGADVRKMLEDLLPKDPEQNDNTVFSLVNQGYQPLGVEQLGGEAAPDRGNVMSVETDQVLYLRARSLDVYNGASWQQSVGARQYGYQTLLYRSMREKVFGIGLPGAGAPKERTARITLLRDMPSSLFSPLRLLEMETSADLTAYFTASGDLSAQRDLRAGDSYTVTYLPMMGDSETVRALAERNLQSRDDYIDEINAAYLKAPTLQYEVQALLARMLQGADTPYEKASAIMRYLCEHYPYTLDVPDPPQGVDFVSYFLLGEQRGYCTYFATAMTVLCRMAGVPARYVEGYVALPDERGVCIVTGDTAHAWTEVYLRGVGWVTFDATPTHDSLPQNDGQTPPPEETSAPQDEATPAPEGGSATPTPEPPVLTTPTPEPNTQSTPTPAPQDADAPTATPEPQAVPPDADDSRPPFPWWLLIALALIGLCVWRVMASDPHRACKKLSARRALFVYAYAVTLSLRLLGLRRESGETLRAYYARADKRVSLPRGYVAALERAHYGRDGADESAVRASKLAYDTAYAALKAHQKIALRVLCALPRKKER